MYKVEKCIYPHKRTEPTDGYVIESDNLDSYPYPVNKYLHKVSQGSPQTAKQYAYRICKWMNFLLNTYGITYEKATVNNLKAFLKSLTLKKDEDGISLFEDDISAKTLKGYLYPIRSLYADLDEQDYDIAMELKRQKASANRNSFMYGQIWTKERIDMLIQPIVKKSPTPRKHIKYYEPEEIEDILNCFNTTRDKAIFSLTLDGLRIDEAISLRFSRYDPSGDTYELYRSKGKITGDVERVAILSQRTIKYLEDYTFSERAQVEDDYLNEGKVLTDFMFVNLKKRAHDYGQPIHYRNWLGILKTAAKNAGFNPARIRTHSGRSTRAGELFLIQAKNPATLTDNQILDIMGWKNMSSANPYKNRNDREIAKENLKKIQNARKKDKHE